MSSPDSMRFPLFAALPPELRRQIWHQALPIDIKPALCLYRNDLWHHRLIQPSEEHYGFSCPELVRYYNEFRHVLLGGCRLEIPVAFVNREAYQEAFRWIKTIRGIKYSNSTSTFTLPFDVGRDAVYLPRDRLGQFENGRPSIDDTTILRCSVRNLAISESVFRSEQAGLCEICTPQFSTIDTMMIIIDPPSTLFEDDNADQCWELQSIPRGSFFWNEDSKCYDLKGQDCYDKTYEVQYKWIEEVLDTFWEATNHFNWGNHCTEVRPVLAVRR